MKILAVIKPESVDKIARLRKIEDLYSSSGSIELQIDITNHRVDGKPAVPPEDVSRYIIQV